MRVVTMRAAGRFFVGHDGGAGALLQRECGGNKNLSGCCPIPTTTPYGTADGIPASSLRILDYILLNTTNPFTYDHRLQRTRDPVRSPIFKL
jgi:hypothetical protein